MNADGQIYRTLVSAAERDGQPYGGEQHEAIRSTVQELLKEPTSAARPGMLLGRIQRSPRKPMSNPMTIESR
jgi:hypothetical protein